MATIEITVSNMGDVMIHARGYSGNTCEAATRFIEEAIGKVTKRTATPERFEGAEIAQKREAF